MDDVALSNTLSEEQWATYDEIMSSVDVEHRGSLLCVWSWRDQKDLSI